MCVANLFGANKTPKVDTPAPSPAPAGQNAADAQSAPMNQDDASGSSALAKARKGRSSLRIDLQGGGSTPGVTGSGLSIPQ